MLYLSVLNIRTRLPWLGFLVISTTIDDYYFLLQLSCWNWCKLMKFFGYVEEVLSKYVDRITSWCCFPLIEQKINWNYLYLHTWVTTMLYRAGVVKKPEWSTGNNNCVLLYLRMKYDNIIGWFTNEVYLNDQ